MKPALLALLLLAGCASAPPADPQRAACERQAEDDPAVKELIIKGAGNPYFQLESQDRLRRARQQAVLACLRSRGLAPRGGVELQQPL